MYFVPKTWPSACFVQVLCMQLLQVSENIPTPSHDGRKITDMELKVVGPRTHRINSICDVLRLELLKSNNQCHLPLHNLQHLPLHRIKQTDFSMAGLFKATDDTDTQKSFWLCATQLSQIILYMRTIKHTQSHGLHKEHQVVQRKNTKARI